MSHLHLDINLLPHFAKILTRNMTQQTLHRQTNKPPSRLRMSKSAWTYEENSYQKPVLKDKWSTHSVSGEKKKPKRYGLQQQEYIRIKTICKK